MTQVFNKPEQKEKRRILRNRMTKAEYKLWYYLKSKQLLGFKFRRQSGVGSYIVDFYCSSAKLVIEVDGDSHAGSLNKRNDAKRQREIEALGLKVIRFTDLEVMRNIESVLEVIRSLLRPPLTPPS
jgi:very-short-patch-repair endonuclease